MGYTYNSYKMSIRKMCNFQLIFEYISWISKFIWIMYRLTSVDNSKQLVNLDCLTRLLLTFWFTLLERQISVLLPNIVYVRILSTNMGQPTVFGLLFERECHDRWRLRCTRKVKPISGWEYKQTRQAIKTNGRYQVRHYPSGWGSVKIRSN